MNIPNKLRPFLRTVLRHKRVATIACAIFVLFVTWNIYFNFSVAGKLPAKLLVSGQAFENNSSEEVYQTLKKSLAEISVTYKHQDSGITHQTSSGESGLSVDKQSIEDWKIKRGIRFPSLNNKQVTQQIPVTFDRTELDTSLEVFRDAKSYKPPVNARFQYSDGSLSIANEEKGYGVSLPDVEGAIRSKLQSSIENVSLSLRYTDLEPPLSSSELEPLRSNAETLLSHRFALVVEEKEEQIPPEQIVTLFDPIIENDKPRMHISQSRARELVTSLVTKYDKQAINKVTSSYKSGKPSIVTTAGAQGRTVSNIDRIVSELVASLHEPKDFLGKLEFQITDFEEKTVVVDDIAASRTVTYEILVWGNVKSDVATFTQYVGETLQNAKGWAAAGINFVKVSSGANFSIVLAEPARVDAAAGICDSYYSCRVGRYVIINDDRWAGATAPWTGTLRDYRHMVVNHETGHWLGLGHANCGGAGQLAPLMQQQSANLQGCRFNPWPLPSEINAVRN